MKQNFVKLETYLEKSSPLFLGYDIDDILFEQIEQLSPDKIFFITDNSLFSIHGATLFKKLQKHFNSHLILMNTGELSKNIFTLQCICEKIFQHKVSKDSLLISFGGGVVGNVVGLAAALIYRGIPFIEIPTTFLGQTDSVLSNKQAVNSLYSKNMLGVYYEPKVIINDIKYLISEPYRYFKSGLIESVKNGLISDKTFLDWILENDNYQNIQKDIDLLYEMVYKSILSKINIITKDPSEKKHCMILEYGHTFGHALEAIGNGTITHGEAISIGMVLAAQISNKMGYMSYDEVEFHKYIFKSKFKMNIQIPDTLSSNEVFNVMENDNKRNRNGIVFVILKSIAEPLEINGSNLLKVPAEIYQDIFLNMKNQKEKSNEPIMRSI